MIDVLADILAFPILLIDLAFGAAGFSSHAFKHVAASQTAQSIAYIIAFLAGVSEMLGQSVVLVINRVPAYRFLASLAFTGVSYLFTIISWAVAILIVTALSPIETLSLNDLLPATGILALAFAPRLLGVFCIAPYFGTPLSNTLEAWTMALAIFGLQTVFTLPFAAALFVGLTGWSASYGLRAFFGYALSKPLNRLRITVSGSLLEKSPNQILAETIAALSKVTRQ